jgi:multidrug efflux pump subunit AcrA (membrane-fusion protein)
MSDMIRPVQTNHRSYARCGYTAIGLVFGGFGIWAALAPLDRAAIASGQVSVETDHKVVQHLEGGIIREILVKETQLVEEGDVLFRLQPTQAQANTDLLRKQIDAALAQEARHLAERKPRWRSPISSANLRRAANPSRTRSAS